MPERIMNRMPVPVHDAVRTGGKMAVSLLAELALVWRPSWKSLCLGFHNKIVVVFQRTNHITAKRDFRTGQIILGRMVNISSGDRQTFYQLFLFLPAINHRSVSCCGSVTPLACLKAPEACFYTGF